MTDLAVAVTVTDSAGLKTSASSTITVSTATTTITLGLTTVGTIGGGGAGNLYAQGITLAQAASLVSLTFNSRGATGSVRLGLYSGTSPTTLIAQTAAFTPVNGWNTVALTSAQLPAGPYWLAHWSSASGYWATVPGGPAYYKAMASGPMPATFPASASSEGASASFYGTFSTVSTPPPPSGTPIGVGLSSVSVGKPPNANSVVGIVNVTTAGGGAYTGTLTLGGTDAAKFALTHGGVLPCNLVVGPIDIAAGSYNITITAN